MRTYFVIDYLDVSFWFDFPVRLIVGDTVELYTFIKRVKKGNFSDDNYNFVIKESPYFKVEKVMFGYNEVGDEVDEFLQEVHLEPTN